MFFWLKFLNRTESSSFDYLFQTGERSLRVGLMTLTSRFTRHKRMNEKKNLKFSSLSFFLFGFPKSGTRAASVSVCVSPKEHEINMTDMCPGVCCYSLIRVEGITLGKKDKKKKKANGEKSNRVQTHREKRTAMYGESLSLSLNISGLPLSFSLDRCIQHLDTVQMNISLTLE